MAIIIEILVFFGVVGAIIWNAIRDTGKVVSAGVKEKMRERELRMTNDNPADRTQKTFIPPVTNAIPELSNFQNNYTLIEREAIILSLFVLAGSDNEYHPKEEELIVSIAAIIGYDIRISRLQEILTYESPDKYLDVLAVMSEKNKEFYIMWALDLIHADGKVTDEEHHSIQAIFAIMNITPEKIKYTIGKMNMLRNHFKF